MSKWIFFRESGTSKSGATKVWNVHANPVPSKEGDGTLERPAFFLGQVKWFGRWRCYAFFPDTETTTVFEKDCLRDLADFCDEKTKEQRGC